MKVDIWCPGTDTRLDTVYEELRGAMHLDSLHRLRGNYDAAHFKDCTALSIYWQGSEPVLCSSILKRACWPHRVYRILNRAWKPRPQDHYLRKISDCMGYTVLAQLSWLEQNTDCGLAFISRETAHWQTWVARGFKAQFNVEFEIAPDKYQTCDNAPDPSCWQYILYRGQSELLTHWAHT